MIDHLYLFSDLNRDAKNWSLEDTFAWKPCKIISMGDDEDAYLFSMQFMLGEAKIIPFQKFHDDYWCDLNYKKKPLKDFLGGHIFCSHPQFLEYMMDYRGDLKWQKAMREKQHWSQQESQWILPSLDLFR